MVHFNLFYTIFPAAYSIVIIKQARKTIKNGNITPLKTNYLLRYFRLAITDSNNFQIIDVKFPSDIYLLNLVIKIIEIL